MGRQAALFQPLRGGLGGEGGAPPLVASSSHERGGVSREGDRDRDGGGDRSTGTV